MNWTQVKIYTTTEGIEPLTGSLLDLGIGGFVIEDAQDFDEFLHDTTPHWDYIDQDVMKKMKNCDRCPSEGTGQRRTLRSSGAGTGQCQ